MNTIVHEGTLQALMRGCEALLRLLARHRLEHWLDWGTLLGCVRHGNIIPWDYDADLCMPWPAYQRLRALLAEHDGQLDNLLLYPDYYGADDQTIMLGFADWPDDAIGIDIVAYDLVDDHLRSRLGPQLLADFPAQYDSPAELILPLARLPMLGRHAQVPRRPEARLVECFGPDWRTPNPQAHADPPLDPRLSSPPWRPLPREPGAAPHIRRATATDPLATPGLLHTTFANRDSSPQLVWALADNTIDRPHTSFTELVFEDHRRLWGHVLVGELAPGDALELPHGAVAWLPELTELQGSRP